MKTLTLMTTAIIVLSGAAIAQTAEPTASAAPAASTPAASSAPTATTTTTVETPTGTTTVQTDVVAPPAASSGAPAQVVPAAPVVVQDVPTARDAITGKPIGEVKADEAEKEEESLRDRVRNKL